MATEKLMKETGELSEESLARMFQVEAIDDSTQEMIKRNVEMGAFLRFVVSVKYNIYIAPGSYTHQSLVEKNGLEWSDCMVTNGVLKEEDNGDILFIYHSATRSAVHGVIEKQILGYLEKISGIKLSSRRVSSVYSTD